MCGLVMLHPVQKDTAHMPSTSYLLRGQLVEKATRSPAQDGAINEFRIS